MMYMKPNFNQGSSSDEIPTAGGPSSSMNKSLNQSMDVYWYNKKFGGSVMNPISGGKKPNNLF